MKIEDKNSNKAAVGSFECSADKAFVEVLQKINSSISVTTYDTRKVIFFSYVNGKINQMMRNFDTPMGMAVYGRKLALAIFDKIIYFTESGILAKTYPKKENTYDSLFVPTRLQYTGRLNMHDLVWHNEQLVGVNSNFSCLCLFTDDYHFIPIWKPHFITEIDPRDRCHLNGIALKDGKIKFVTAFGATNEPGSFREKKFGGGILMDVESNEIILSNLSMPHSPRHYRGNLYICNSAEGEIVKVNLPEKKWDVIAQLPGFTRGMAFYEDYIFVGLSKVRRSEQDDRILPILKRLKKEEIFCGIVVLHEPTGNIVGFLKISEPCHQIYDLQIIQGKVRPNILGIEDDLHYDTLVMPEAAFWAKEKK